MFSSCLSKTEYFSNLPTVKITGSDRDSGIRMQPISVDKRASKNNYPFFNISEVSQY